MYAPHIASQWPLLVPKDARTMIKDVDTMQPYIECVWRLCYFGVGGLGLERCLSTTYVLSASEAQNLFLAE